MRPSWEQVSIRWLMSGPTLNCVWWCVESGSSCHRRNEGKENNGGVNAPGTFLVFSETRLQLFFQISGSKKFLDLVQAITSWQFFLLIFIFWISQFFPAVQLQKVLVTCKVVVSCMKLNSC